MSLEIWIAIIGVGGTLLGTLLGWILNNISRRGTLKLLDVNYIMTFEDNINGCMQESIDPSNAEFCRYKVSFNVFNSSSEPKIMRNIKLLFLYKEIVLKENIPNDDEKRKFSSGLWFSESVTAVTIMPKSVISFHLSNGFYRSDSGLDFVYKSNTVKMRYEDERKIYIISLKKEGK